MFEEVDALRFLGQIAAYGGGGAAIAYFVFQHLGKSWIESRFAERLEQLRHQQALELQRLRVEIDALLSGAIRLQEREFEVLPEAWSRLDEVHGLAEWLVSPLQQYADVDRMDERELEEFLAGTELPASQKEKIRRSREKLATYQEIVFWHRLHKVKKSFGEFQRYVARTGIFLPPELKAKFATIADALWSAVIAKEVGHDAKDWKIQREGWKKLKEEVEPVYRSIEADIQARLRSHARKL